MSNTNNNMQTQTSNALHNAIMEAGGKNHPPMLAPENHPYQYKFRAINTDATPTTLGNDDHSLGIYNDIYYQLMLFTSQEGETLDSYYSSFYKMMNELVRNQCIITNHQVNVQFLLQLKPEWQRFVTIVKQSQDLKNVSYHKLYDILKQHQNEVNEIRAKRLALCAADEISSKEKEIDKLIALISMSFKKIYKPTNNNLITSSNTRNTNVDNTPRTNKETGYDKQTWQYDNQRAVNDVGARENAAYHKKKMLLCKQEEAGIQLSAEQVDWRDDTDDEPED
ncbi:hypothetical protein Tco_1385876 [Tanacetum coccineum]